MPIIAIDREMNPEFFCSVVSDDHDACQQLTHSLLQTRPRHIALIGARPELSISRARAAGFKHALDGFAGTTIIEHGEAFSRQCGQRLMTEMLQRQGHFPDALITTSYVLLQGVFDVLQSQALQSTPLHLGTFGDTQLLDFLPLPVNAMAQQHQLIADKAPAGAGRYREGRLPAGRARYCPGLQTTYTRGVNVTLIDTHTHLDFPDFDADRARVLDNCRTLGVQRMVVLGVYQRNWQRLWELTEANPRCMQRSACIRFTSMSTAPNT